MSFLYSWSLILTFEPPVDMSTGESLVKSKMICQASLEYYNREISRFEKVDVERNIKHEMEATNTAFSYQEFRGTDEVFRDVLHSR